MDHVFAIGGFVGGHDGVAFDGHRQDETVIVISMFTDDVDAAGGSDDPARRAAVMFLKFSGDVGGEILEVHVENILSL